MLSKKLLDMFLICDAKNIQYDMISTYSCFTQKKWARQFIDTIESLKKWEIQHTG